MLLWQKFREPRPFCLLEALLLQLMETVYASIKLFKHITPRPNNHNSQSKGGVMVIRIISILYLHLLLKFIVSMLHKFAHYTLLTSF